MRYPIKECKFCLKKWYAHSAYCPENTRDNPFPGDSKWGECVCFIHTCYNIGSDLGGGI